MSSRAGDSGPDEHGRLERRDEFTMPAVPDSELLERVLDETLSCDAVSRLEPVEIQALANVARRYQGASLVTDPIAIELVESLLKARFRGLGVSATLWRDVSRQIAATLYDAPDTHEKLQRFWSQLSKVVT